MWHRSTQILVSSVIDSWKKNRTKKIISLFFAHAIPNAFLKLGSPIYSLALRMPSNCYKGMQSVLITASISTAPRTRCVEPIDVLYDEYQKLHRLVWRKIQIRDPDVCCLYLVHSEHLLLPQWRELVGEFRFNNRELPWHGQETLCSTSIKSTY